MSRTDWRYTIEYLEDTRTAVAREADAGLPPSGGGVPDHVVRTIVRDRGRMVVGENNVGRVHFETNPSGVATTVVHRLYWQSRALPGSALAGAVMFTEMKAPLTTPTAAERPTVTQ